MLIVRKYVMRYVRIILVLLVSLTLTNCANRSHTGAVLGATTGTTVCLQYISDNPYLIAMGTVKWDMLNPEMVMIGNSNGQPTGKVEQLENFYNQACDVMPRIEFGTWEECEAIKIFWTKTIEER